LWDVRRCVCGRCGAFFRKNRTAKRARRPDTATRPSPRPRTVRRCACDARRTRSRKTPLVLVTAALATGPPSLFWQERDSAHGAWLPATSGPCRSSNESGITRGCARRTGFGRRRGTRPIGESRGGRGPVSRGVAGESYRLDHRARPRGRHRALAGSVKGCRHVLVIKLTPSFGIRLVLPIQRMLATGGA
jgi:hypothetical protein